MEAAVSGTGEVGMAVLASALTTMCVFIPFFFLGSGSSRIVRFMGDAGLTICLAVAVSTVVSLAVIPLAASRLFRPGAARHDRRLKVAVAVLLLAALGWKVESIGWEGLAAWGRTTGARVLETTLGMQWSTAAVLGAALVLVAALLRHFRRHGMRASYVRLLDWTLDHRAVTLGVAVAMMGGGVWMFLNIEQQGLRWPSERRVDITVETERSFSLGEVDSLMARIEQDLLAHAGELDLETLSTRIRQRRSSLRARLVDADEGSLTTMEAQQGDPAPPAGDGGRRLQDGEDAQLGGQPPRRRGATEGNRPGGAGGPGRGRAGAARPPARRHQRRHGPAGGGGRRSRSPSTASRPSATDCRRGRWARRSPRPWARGARPASRRRSARSA